MTYPTAGQLGAAARRVLWSSADGRTLVGIYLWRKADAEAFLQSDWVAGVTGRWGVMPTRSKWQMPQVVESAGGRVIRDHAPALVAAE